MDRSLDPDRVPIDTAFPDFVALLGGLGTLFAILGAVVIATMYWDSTTDRGAFVGIAIGWLSSTVFVVSTGTVQVGPVVGLVSTLAAVVLVSLLDRSVPIPEFPSVR